MGSYLVIIAVLINFFLHQEKKANSSGCVADTKSMYRTFLSWKMMKSLQEQ